MARKVIICFFILFITIFFNPIKSNAEAVSKVTIKELIVKHSLEMGLDPAMALSIAKAESGFCHEKRSRYGAIGVFQLMPSTAKRMGYNPYHINENIKDISEPSLIVWGDIDQLVPYSSIEFLKQYCENVHVQVIEKLSHLMLYSKEYPIISKYIFDFLDN